MSLWLLFLTRPKVLLMPPPASSRKLRLASPRKSPRRTSDSSTTIDAKKRPFSSTSRLSTSPTSASLSDRIIQALNERADAKTKAWFTNYVKGTVWIGCKVPTVRAAIKDSLGKPAATTKKRKKNDNVNNSNVMDIDNATVFDSAMELLKNEACDAKLAGMLLLSEQYPRSLLATNATLDRLDDDLWKDPTTIADWSTADWFSNKVLSKIVFHKENHALQRRVLGYAQLSEATLWQRRCGIVPFLQYHKQRDLLPDKFGGELIQACEKNLMLSPNERFTQTGIGWVLRYVLNDKEHPDSKLAIDFVCRHGSIWTTEAKKSFCEKFSKSDARRRKIMGLS